MAQTPPEPTIRTTGAEVLVDFVARDKAGRIVRDLKPEEVRIYEDDVPQQVRALNFFDAGTPGQPEQTRPPAAPGLVTGRSRAWQELRSVNVVTAVFSGPFDPQSDEGVVARDLMREVLSIEMHPDTYLGVFTLDHGVLRLVLPYCNDAAEVGPALIAAVENATGRKVAGERSAPVQVGAGGTRATMSPAMRAAVDRAIVRLMRPVAAEDDKTGQVSVGMAMSTPAAPEGASVSESRLLALLHLVQAQTEFPGRKLLIYVGRGLGVDAQFQELQRSLVGAANRAGVAICGIDLNPLIESEVAAARSLLSAAARASQAEFYARSDQPVTRERVLALEMAEQSVVADSTKNLENLAKETGGEFIGRTNDLRTPLRREMEDNRSHWELTYAPSDVTEDGRFRKLKVTVSRPGVTVTARSGYYALPMVNGEQIALFEYAPLMALRTSPAPRELEFYTAALRFRPGPKVQYAVVFESPLRGVEVKKEPNLNSKAKAAKAVAHVSFLALVKDAKGTVADRVSRDLVLEAAGEAELRAGVAMYAAPLFLAPGRYTVESAVVDRNSGKAGTRRAALVVERGAGLALSDATLVRGVEPAEGTPDPNDPLVIRTGRVGPNVRATTRAGEDLGVFATAYPDARSAAPLQVEVELLREGQRVAGREYGRVNSQNGPQPILATLSSRGLKAGQYEARITVRQGELTRQEVLPVTLVE